MDFKVGRWWRWILKLFKVGTFDAKMVINHVFAIQKLDGGLKLILLHKNVR